MKATLAGARTCRVRFERAGVTTDDNGTEVPIWAEIGGAGKGLAWAQVNYGRGDERRAASRENVSLTATFRVMSTSMTRSLTPADRLVTRDDERAWDILSVVPYGAADIDVTAIWSA